MPGYNDIVCCLFNTSRFMFHYGHQRLQAGVLPCGSYDGRLGSSQQANMSSLFVSVGISYIHYKSEKSVD